MNIVVIAAHPDDEVLGCGGTIARHAARGDRVDILFAADGETSRPGAQIRHQALRQTAARDAAKILGAYPPKFLDMPDNRLDTIPLLELINAMEEALRGFEPSIVYTHHTGDLNVDHRRVAQAALTLYRPLPGSPVRAIYGFEVLSSSHWQSPDVPFNPVRYVDVTATMDKKRLALDVYRSEIRAFPHARSIEAVDALAKFRGAVCGLNAAEAFTVYRDIETDR